MDVESIEAWKKLGVMICNICHFKASDLGTFQSHICRKKNNTCESYKIGIKYDRHTGRFFCSDCSFEAEENVFVEHLQKHFFRHPFRCDTCKEGYHTRTSILQHSEKHHSKRGTFTLRVSHLSKGILSDAKKEGHVSFTPGIRSKQCKENEDIQSVKMKTTNCPTLSDLSDENMKKKKSHGTSEQSDPTLSIIGKSFVSNGEIKYSKHTKILPVKDSKGDSSVSNGRKTKCGSKHKETLPANDSKGESSVSNGKKTKCGSKHTKTLPVAVKDRKVTVGSTPACSATSHSSSITTSICSTASKIVKTPVSTESIVLSYDHKKMKKQPSISRSSSSEPTSSIPIMLTQIGGIYHDKEKAIDDKTNKEKDSDKLFNSRCVVSEDFDDKCNVRPPPGVDLMSQAPNSIIMPDKAFDCPPSPLYPYCSTAPQTMSESIDMPGHGASNVVSANSSSPYVKKQHIVVSSEKSSCSEARDFVVVGDDPVSAVKQEKLDDFSYLSAMAGICFCSRCKKKFANVNVFYRHIHKHIHTQLQRCCPSGFSLDCSLLQGIISSIDSDCGGKLKLMESSTSSQKQTNDFFGVVKQELDESGNPLGDSSTTQDCHNVSNILRDITLRPSDQVRRSSCEETFKDNTCSLAKINKRHSSFDSFLENCIPPTNLNISEAGCIQINNTGETIDIENDLKQYHHVLNYQMTKNFYKCCFPNCGYSNQQSLELLMHTEANHGNETEFYCVYCGYMGKTVTDFVDHIDVHDENKIEKYSCSIVLNNLVVDTMSKQTLDDLISFLEVKSIEHEGCGFQCNICENRFSSLPKLKNHLMFSALKTFGCRLCRSTFLDSKSFESHSTKVHPGSAKFHRVNFNFLCQFRKQYFLSFCRILRQQITTLNVASIKIEPEILCKDGNSISACSQSTVSLSPNCAPTLLSSNKPEIVVSSPSFSDTNSPPSVPHDDLTDSSSAISCLLHLDNSSVVSLFNIPVSKLPESCDNELSSSQLKTKSSRNNATQALDDIKSTTPTISEAMPMFSSLNTAIKASSADLSMSHKVKSSSVSNNLVESTKGQAVYSSADDSTHLWSKSSSSNKPISSSCSILSSNSDIKTVASFTPCPSYSAELSMTKILKFSSDNTSVLASSQSKPPTTSSSDHHMESITESQFNESSSVSSFLSSLSSVRTMLSTMPYCVDPKRKCDLNAEGNRKKKLKSACSDPGSGEVEMAQLPAAPVSEHLISSPASLTVSFSIMPSKMTSHTVTSECTSTSSQLLSLNRRSTTLNFSNLTSATQSSKAGSVNSERYTPSLDMHVCDGEEESELVIDIDTFPGIHNDMFLPCSHFTEPVAGDDKENEKETILYRCKVCSYDCEWNEGNMMDHIANDKHKYFACGYCENPYFELRLLKNHIRFHHGNASFKYKDLGIEHIFSPKVEGAVFSAWNEGKYKSGNEIKNTLQETRKSVQLLVINNNDNNISDTRVLEDKSEKTLQDDSVCEERVIQEIVVQNDVSICSAQIAGSKQDFVCPSILENNQPLKRKKIKQFGCRRCSLYFVSLHEVERHSKEKHEKAKVKWIDHLTDCIYSLSGRCLRGNITELPAKPYLCSLCSYRSKSRSGVHKHLSMIHPDHTKGPVVVKLHGFSSCISKAVPSLDYGLTPSTEVARRKEPSCYNCHLCYAKLSTEFFLRHHLAKHKGFRHMSTLSTLDGVLICSQCSYIASSNLDLANHVSSHVTDRRYTCSLCDFESHQKKSIDFHILKHGPNSQAKVHDREKKRGKMKLQVVNLNPTVLLKRLRYDE